MLKKTLLSVLAAAAMTACSQVETTSINPNPEGTGYISFSPVVPKATRGTVTKIDQLKESGFYVVAYGENSFYFNRLLAEYKDAADDNKGAGFYLPGKYSWPSYTLTFAAWYPATLPAGGGSATAYDKDDNVIPGEYVSQPVWNEDGSGLAKGQEIRGFVPATAHASQTDIVIARTKANSATYGTGQPVKLNFRHILSQVSFKARKKSGDQLRIEIKEIELRNIPSKGNFVFRKDNDFVTDGNVTEGTTNPALIPAEHWEIVKPEGSHNLTYGDKTDNNVNLQRYKHVLETPVALEPVEEGTEGDAVELLGEGGNMILIPQNFSGNYYGDNSWAWAEGREEKGAYLALKMKVWRKVISEDPDKNWTLIFPAEDDEKTADGYGKAAVGIVSKEGAQDWKPGYHYVYTLNFTDEGVGKHDPETPKGGDDILGDYIWFTVTVDDWIPTNQTPEL